MPSIVWEGNSICDGTPKTEKSLLETDCVKKQDENRPIKEYPGNYRDGSKRKASTREAVSQEHYSW